MSFRFPSISLLSSINFSAAKGRAAVISSTWCLPTSAGNTLTLNVDFDILWFLASLIFICVTLQTFGLCLQTIASRAPPATPPNDLKTATIPKNTTTDQLVFNANFTNAFSKRLLLTRQNVTCERDQAAYRALRSNPRAARLVHDAIKSIQTTVTDTLAGILEEKGVDKKQALKWIGIMSQEVIETLLGVDAKDSGVPAQKFK
ncbi:hypothetical protein K458DRAFT_395556 [Lentithecium fluviatile CBS 122367]|uniref:Uncharacterized protein n=1 Tax=Lentithecium fluviatile CBS 122367 TaxID=1168545 RepID=A0A6G1IIF3_9PLEO|nr:hypothetical protein K458DRAFT_395556 [Lentithecium fluviatile CBS 122367]